MSYRDPVEHESIDPHEHLAAQEIGDEEHLPLHPHVTPFWTMFWVFAILLFLTALTVWTSNVHDIRIGNTLIPFSGTAHILIAMGIAVVKALLVAAFFMHLLYDKKVNSIIVASTVFALSLFIGLSLLDIDTRGMTSSVEKNEIYPGGNMSYYNKMEGAPKAPDASAAFPGNIVEYTEEANTQAADNPDEAHGADEHSGEDAPEDGHAEESAEPDAH